MRDTARSAFAALGIAMLAGCASVAEAGPDAAAASGLVPENIAAPAEELGRAFAAVAARVKPAVVSVYSEKIVTIQAPRFPFRGEPERYRVPESGVGSGMILDARGHILTNYHVVAEVDKIKVKLADKRVFDAKVVGGDPYTDVAVIQIEGRVPEGLPTVLLGDSDALEEGNLMMAIGAPFGLTQTVTTGIVSAKGRSDVGIAAIEDFIQTDAPINPGNSGGPLVNMRGEVVGMTSAIATAGEAGQSAGVGFAIPSNMIKSMLPVLIRGGRIARGMLGVGIQDLTEELAEQFQIREAKGALVSQVAKDSPAARAGLKPGDVIVRYDGKDVPDAHQLRKLVAATAPGTRVAVGVIRNGKEQTFDVTVGTLPVAPVSEAAMPSGPTSDRLAALGLSVQGLTPDLARQFDLQGDKGVLISAVEPGSPAWDADLQAGDLIMEIDRVRVTTVGELNRALARAKDRVLLLVKRQGATTYVVLSIK
jgi:serine protease Do